MKKPLTVREISEKAEVLLGTESRVMNNAANIDPELKEHTLPVIWANNYVSLRRPCRNSRRNAAKGGRIAVLELISRIDAKSRGVKVPLNSRLLSGTLIERDSLVDI